MFEGCTALTSAPALPATTLNNYCYWYMFKHCTSLSTAPSLPATTLANSCYRSMFANCTSITSAPTLSATELVNQCYYHMFYNCTNLSSISVSFSEWNDEISATTDWVVSITTNGTFTCPAALDTTTKDASHIP